MLKTTALAPLTACEAPSRTSAATDPPAGTRSSSGDRQVPSVVTRRVRPGPSALVMRPANTAATNAAIEPAPTTRPSWVAVRPRSRTAYTTKTVTSALVTKLKVQD